MTKEEIIYSLGLELHPIEGGYFKRTYESNLNISCEGSERKLLSSIYYLLTGDSPYGCLHRNKSDILHFHHLGSPILYLIISPDGRINEQVLGPDINKGQQLQLVVKAGDWKASQLCAGDYGLISEAVAPGFEYDDNEIATPEIVKQLFPSLVTRLEKYLKPRRIQRDPK
jgi:predicted cupin superfamily sugar epimerase